MKTTVNNEYIKRGCYHKNLDSNWSYYPFFLKKNQFVLNYLQKKVPRDARIADIGCGEGVLVKAIRKAGYRNTYGYDFYYQDNKVKKGDLLSISKTIKKKQDVVLCLDVLEHLQYLQQPQALQEINKIMHKESIAIISVPNLAHFWSRISFIVFGRLTRTSKLQKHPGDRSFTEYIKLFNNENLSVVESKGFFLTFPLWERLKFYRFMWLFHLFCFILPFPSLSFLNIFVLRRNDA